MTAPSRPSRSDGPSPAPMKPLLSLLAALLLPAVAFAQEGTVTYEQTIKLDIQLPPEMAHMQGQIPDSRTDTQLLLFNPDASLQKNAPREENEDEFAGDGRRMRFRMGRPADDSRFTDFETGQVVERRDFMGRTFLITDEPEPLAWRLTSESAVFLGYTSHKAVAKRDTVDVEAWFTPEIPVPAGPAQYGGLPGLILVLTEDGGRRSFVAKDVALAALPADALAPPTEGREVTREEFDAIVKEKMEEMGAGRRGRGTVIIR